MRGLVCFLWILVGTTAFGQVSPEHAPQMAKGLDLFKKTVGPVFAGRCVKCHGGESTEAEFNLTTRELLLKGGAEGPVLVPGKSQESRLYRLIAHLEEPHMPEDGAQLSAADLAAVASWIDLGAPYDKPLAGPDTDPMAWTGRTIEEARRDFWSFLPLRKVGPPVLADDSWSQTPIDQFILAAAREKGVTPNSPADRRTLLRRAYFDLIGLPPTADEIERFVNNPDPEAYSRLIDRLLESPHYGERWGRHWLDVARFAESHGFEQDYDRPHAYHFRDFVIKALNSDMPYDQFVRWQLAGDEIAPHDPLAMMATGFLGAGVFPTQLTEKEFEPARYDELDDMVSTLSTAMLGLTLGCARCHDHKFDPIPAADYYRMAATFATTIRSEVELDLDPAQHRQAQAAFDQVYEPLAAALRAYESGELAEKFANWLADAAQPKQLDAKWQILDLLEFQSLQGAEMAKVGDGSILVSGKSPQHDQYRFTAETRLRNITAIRLDAMTHPSLVKGGPGRASNGNFALSDFRVSAQPLGVPDAELVPVKLVDARATHQQDTGHLSVKASIDDGTESGWAVDGGGIGHDQSAVFDCQQPIGFEHGVRLVFELRFSNNVRHSIGRPRLSVTTAPAPVAIEGKQVDQHIVDAFQVLQVEGADKLSETQRAALRRWHAERDPGWLELHRAVTEQESRRPKPALTKVMVTSEGFKPIPHHADDRGFPHYYPDVYFLRRGDTQQKNGIASPGFLQVLLPRDPSEQRWQREPPAGSRTSHRRYALAMWITDTDRGAGNLLARVIANRLWHHHLGRGIVATPNDFGYQGQRPTHPELLDWLAAELIDDGWRLKGLHKRIMTSAVYLQAATVDEADARIDPENVWLWRFSPRRLEAETIRDSLLAVAGELDRTQFGPGTLDESMKRRSIYFMIKRSKLIPMIQLFDAPEPLVGVGDRPSTTIAPQSLMFLNSPQARDYARALARRVREGDAKPEAATEETLRRAYRLALTREPTKQELPAATEFVRTQAESYRADGQSDPELLALADFCQVLFSLNEFIYVE